MHRIVAVRTTSDYEDGCEDDGGPYWTTRYRMPECMGCQSVVLEEAVEFSEVDEIGITFYPPRISRELPVWAGKLPRGERGLLEETYTALQAGSSRLAIMGARALIDLLMNREIGDVGGFAEKLEALQQKGVVSAANAKVLKAALEMSHAVAHRGHLAEDEQVSAVFDIVENVLHASVLNEAARTLAKATPKRKRRSGSREVPMP